MPLYAIPFPAFDPVLISFGPIAIRWYALAYIVGILLGWLYARTTIGNEKLWGGPAPLTVTDFDDFVLWVTLGIILGGRLGYVLFYNPSYFVAHPLESLQLWKGGMSFHGGFLGCVLAVVLFARHRGISILSLGDLTCAAGTIGIFLGRIANFINGELWGRPTDVPWAMVFPDRRPAAAPSQPALRGRARGARAVRGADRIDPRRRAQASGFHPRRVRVRLRRRARDLRTISRARCAARVPVGRPDHGNAAVAAIDAGRSRHHVGRHATPTGEVDMMANRGVPLEVEIRRRIEGSGPIAVAPYMELCLTHPERGYYTTGDPFGARGDFITAPEISQMFGELVGLWAAAVWGAMGSPGSLNLVELGPGRGTMMSDVLRVAKVMPGFRAAIALHMIEISPALERLQRQALSFADVPMSWHRSIEEVPDGPLIVLANEFFDALPIHQAVMCADGWHQRVIKIGEGDAFQFSTERDPIPLFDKMLPRNLSAAQIGDIFEWRADNIALEIGRRVVHFGGAALIIDYGHVESAIGDTLQAVGRHKVAEPLLTPGEVDLTAHVDFQALAQAAEGMGARVHGPVPQSVLLRRLGIEERADALKASAPPDYAADDPGGAGSPHR